MTTKDKTGDQLMASIRKAKTEGVTSAQEPAATPKAEVATPKAAPRKKVAAKARPAAPQRPRTTKKPVAAAPQAAKTTTKVETVSYQSSGRVWPD